MHNMVMEKNKNDIDFVFDDFLEPFTLKVGMEEDHEEDSLATIHRFFADIDGLTFEEMPLLEKRLREGSGHNQEYKWGCKGRVGESDVQDFLS